MSLGGASKSKKVKSALTPMGFSSPFGTLTYGKRGSTYTPNLSGNYWDAFNTAEYKMANAAKSLPDSVSAEDIYNNPFYDSTVQLLSNPINRQYSQDMTDLNNELGARNQLGSSYDALMRRNMMQGRDYNLNQAQLQARGTSADAYNNAINQALAIMAGTGNLRGNLMEQAFAPAKMAAGLQSAITPLQVAQANYISSQPTFGDRLMDYYGGMSKAFASGLGSYAASACWVAREVYGEESPKWVQFRDKLLTEAPEDIKAMYLIHGPQIAESIKGDDMAKSQIRDVMDNIIGAAA